MAIVAPNRRRGTGGGSSYYYCAIDVLTDGSEGSFAGMHTNKNATGGAAVFLSVHKSSAQATTYPPPPQSIGSVVANDNDLESDPHPPAVARYAVSGIGDLTSRLASDQRYKLGCVRAVFTGTPRTISGMDLSSGTLRIPATAALWGLPALYLALQSAGAEALTVVTGSTPSRATSTTAPPSPLEPGASDDDSNCYVEQVVQLLHSRSRYPTVRTCQVPGPTLNTAASHEEAAWWWKVYEDEFVIVHARSVVVAFSNHAACAVQVYMFTLLGSTFGGGKSQDCSILVVPPGFFGAKQTGGSLLEAMLDPTALPVQPRSIQLGVAIEPLVESSSFLSEIASSSLRIPWIHTQPTGGGSDSSSSHSRVLEHDPFLLVRASHQAQLLHQTDASHFPWSHGGASSDASSSDRASRSGAGDRPGSVTTGDAKDRLDNKSSNTALLPRQSKRLRTGHSIFVLGSMKDGGALETTIVDRTRSLLRSTSEEASSNQDSEEVEAADVDCIYPFVSDRYSLLDDPPYHSNPSSNGPVDDNQIDLDGCLDEDDDIELDSDPGDDAPSPPGRSFANVELLCLGTGCAAPSPYRGASGYAILLNPTTSVVLEAGEGFVTQWNRHAQHRHCLSTIRIICISHAHWDHFGGLLPLLLSIHNLHHQEDEVAEAETIQQVKESKRPRLLNGRASPQTSIHRAPLLVAPDRVLKYVALSLDDVSSYCIPISLQRRDFTAVVSGHLSALARENGDDFRECDDHVAPTAPAHQKKRPKDSSIAAASSLPVPTVLTLDKVRVDHCPHSYGFVLAMDRPAGDPGQSTTNGEPYRPFLLCYSGDTRPCEDLVRACHFWSHRYGTRRIDLLLHEATFDDADRDQCDTKRHSTVSDAIEVSKRMNADRTLLTHFSQRYSSSRRDVGSSAPPRATIPATALHDRDQGDRAPPPPRVMGATDGLLIKLF